MSCIFQDAKERAWSLSMTYGDIKRVLSLTGVNLCKPGTGKKVTSEEELESMPEEDLPLYVKLAGDPIMLLDVVYALVEPQAREKGVSSEEFGQSITPSIFGELSDKFWEAYHVFFLESRDLMSAKMVQIVPRLRKEQAKQAEKMDGILDTAMGQLDRKIDEQIQTMAK